MLRSAKEDPNTLSQKVRKAYNHKHRRIISASTGLTIILCRISLQFCCTFIDNNRSNVILARNVARFLKLPTSILYIANSVFTLRNLEDYKNPKKNN